LRILLHSIHYAPQVTSTGKYSGEMGEWLAMRGHEVRVVTAPPYYPAWEVGEGYSGWAYQRERLAEADVWRCPLWVPGNPSGIKRLLHLASFAASSLPVTAWQAVWRPDVVVLVVPYLICAPSAWLTARLCGAKTWLHLQDLELDLAVGLGMLGGGVARHALYGMEKLLIGGAERVSTITEAMRRRLIEKGIPEERMRLFPNWADIDLVRPMPPNPGVRRLFGAEAGNVLVMYAGNMGEKQGLDLVLETADRLKRRTEIKFAMVGAGPVRPRLEQTAKRRKLHNVRFFPVQSLERLPQMLAAGDVHLVVQRQDTADLVMPSKLTNILAAGRPSVATAAPSTALYEVLNGHGCGIMTAPGSAEELTRAIITLADNAWMRERLGRKARKYAEAYLGKEEILSKFEEELRGLVGKDA
jgi:colanic acid biosynthesis glycosyl transferase WcaI